METTVINKINTFTMIINMNGSCHLSGVRFLGFLVQIRLWHKHVKLLSHLRPGTPHLISIKTTGELAQMAVRSILE